MARPAGRGHLLRHVPDQLGAVGQHDHAALARHVQGDRAADALRRAGDDAGLALEPPGMDHWTYPYAARWLSPMAVTAPLGENFSK